ncbi:4Fe-4S binding protein [Sandaracinus amylolyticus]|uniref:4Fe-4S binding protein n=1 Tax=Sandaracinus amylolyticus TaxID=927083 RepID=UPI001F485F6C|nr:4Fe-4S binding protein [Sandaracinus amylolyticus]UJR84145.1 Hypothetical protein I5071_62160 [Sandaracinus amylolyticus]
MERTTRRGLFSMARRLAGGAESDCHADSDAPESTPVDSDVPPWARRAAARSAPHPASVARVLPFACLGGSPSFCSACVEHCPIEGALQLTERAPRVDPDRCDGCGACERVCPAPQRAIVVLPRLPANGARS